MNKKETIKIWVIVDDGDFVQVYRSILQHGRYNPQFHENIDLLTKTNQFSPHLIIFHVNSTIREKIHQYLLKIKQFSKNNNSPKIILSLQSNWFDEDIFPLVDKIIFVPFPIGEFLQAIEDLFR